MKNRLLVLFLHGNSTPMAMMLQYQVFNTLVEIKSGL